ncbi:hypothetical protein C4D60_Mb04t31710 [Musa balbisiana]|uniref:Uncharacterized protein n=1 Tax=Musa balbisiana TaxID=52838 RepID=A0A4S8KG30_MUSBA|nr:hypothetical protein C4D60_Mb04t31710 [Musa balbisiana]
MKSSILDIDGKASIARKRSQLESAPAFFVLVLGMDQRRERDALLRNVISRLASEDTLQTCTLSKKLDSGSASSTSQVNLSLSPKSPHTIKD